MAFITQQEKESLIEECDVSKEILTKIQGEFILKPLPSQEKNIIKYSFKTPLLDIFK